MLLLVTTVMPSFIANPTSTMSRTTIGVSSEDQTVESISCSGPNFQIDDAVVPMRERLSGFALSSTGRKPVVT